MDPYSALVLIWLVASRRVALCLRSYRFAVGMLLMVSLALASAMMGLRAYHERLDLTEIDAAEARLRLEDSWNYGMTRLRTQWRPDVLQVLCTGTGSQIANSALLSGRYPISDDFPRPMRLSLLSTNNFYFDSFQPLDFPTLVIVVATLLAILLGYDVVSGAKEDGTLALCLSYPVRRSAFLLGEACGIFVALALPILAAFVTGAAVLSFSLRGGLPAEAWLRLFGLVGASLLLVLGFLLLSLLLSALTHSSATALVWLLLTWTASSVLVPDLLGWVSSVGAPSTGVAEGLVPVFPAGELDEHLSAKERQIQRLEQLRLLLPVDVYRQLAEKLTYSDLETFWGYVRFARGLNEEFGAWQLRRVKANPKRETEYGREPLDIGDLPSTTFVAREHAGLVREGLLHAGLLAGWVGGLLVLSIWCFEAYDPRCQGS